RLQSHVSVRISTVAILILMLASYLYPKPGIDHGLILGLHLIIRNEYPTLIVRIIKKMPTFDTFGFSLPEIFFRKPGLYSFLKFDIQSVVYYLHFYYI